MADLRNSFAGITSPNPFWLSSTWGRIAFHAASVQGTISDTTSARSGQARLTCAISCKFSCNGRSVISSMLLKPSMRRSGDSSAP